MMMEDSAYVNASDVRVVVERWLAEDDLLMSGVIIVVLMILEFMGGVFIVVGVMCVNVVLSGLFNFLYDGYRDLFVAATAIKFSGVFGVYEIGVMNVDKGMFFIDEIMC